MKIYFYICSLGFHAKVSHNVAAFVVNYFFCFTLSVALRDLRMCDARAEWPDPSVRPLTFGYFSWAASPRASYCCCVYQHHRSTRLRLCGLWSPLQSGCSLVTGSCLEKPSTWYHGWDPRFLCKTSNPCCSLQKLILCSDKLTKTLNSIFKLPSSKSWTKFHLSFI